ncbi:MAG: GntR family transcriptional regulator [Zoogloeaceae bacterium]|jgi:GntR family transcriptional repressor for pyruvate dehydrogenase complex|nr:GntR family transcriptional regulator [Zoogloeaceae bacterium]
MPLSSGLSVPRLSDAIAATLEQRILEGAFKPGDRLPAERELAVELGVSRPSLREAMQKLAFKGLLRRRQGGGTFVTAALQAAFVDPWQETLAAQPNLREDVLEFRRLLAAQTAEWAATRRAEADMTLLAETLARLQTALDADDMQDFEPLAACERAFHQTIADAAHNVLSAHLTATLLRFLADDLRVNLAELKAVPRAFALLKAQQQAMFAAIRERQPAAARLAAEAHIDFVHASLAQSLRSAARREIAVRRLRTESATSAFSTLSP